MTRLTFLLILFLTPMTLGAQVYRCDTPEGTVYSQMPCSENAERLPEFDPVVEAENVSETETAEAESAVEPPTAMENFILTLEKQRKQQFSTIDANMRTLQKQLETKGEDAPDERTREMLERELAALASERESVNNQYTALIREASNRNDAGTGVN